MALTKPILLTTPAFDGQNEHIFSFNVVGGSQVTKNKLVIRNNTTNDIVYSQIQETFKYEHNVAGNKLANGTYYNAVISTFDADGNESSPSTPIQFWCYTTPVIDFINIPSFGIIENSSFNFTFSYNQNEKEKINSFKMNLYNAYKSLISTSGTIYVQDGTPVYEGSYLFAGFENNSVYYIELIVETVEGTIVKTELVELTISYIKPDFFTLVGLVNNCDEGYISIQSNLILIEGKSNPSPPRYINDLEVDLTEDGSWVEFDAGFMISSDFLARAWIRNPKYFNDCIKFSNVRGQTISLRFMQGYENVNSPDLQTYAEIHIKSVNGIEYYIYSNYIDTVSEYEYYNVWLTRVKDVYKLQIASI